ncbi:MAG: hypothetical protein H0W74_04570 [Sphingosinicella sp.]|nr:hypothetical protein [Sphingosinicella sp.]
MIRFILAAFLGASPAMAEEAPFKASAERFANPAACVTHLDTLVLGAKDYDAVRGPYEIAGGDVRIHMVRAEGSGHRIWEYRCLAEKLSERSWSHSMAAGDEEFTVESVARNAEWLKKDAPQD